MTICSKKSRRAAIGATALPTPPLPTTRMRTITSPSPTPTLPSVVAGPAARRSGARRGTSPPPYHRDRYSMVRDDL